MRGPGRRERRRAAKTGGGPVFSAENGEAAAVPMAAAHSAGIPRLPGHRIVGGLVGVGGGAPPVAAPRALFGGSWESWVGMAEFRRDFRNFRRKPAKPRRKSRGIGKSRETAAEISENRRKLTSAGENGGKSAGIWGNRRKNGGSRGRRGRIGAAAPLGPGFRRIVPPLGPPAGGNQRISVKRRENQ